MLGDRLGRYPNNELTICIVLLITIIATPVNTKHLHSIDTTSAHVGPTLYKWYTMLHNLYPRL